MEALIAGVIAVMTSCGIYLMLRARTFPVIVGLTLLTYAVNLFIFVMGRLHTGEAPIIGTSQQYTDPLPQALVLTAIVISFAMTAFILVLALRARAELGNDHVDGIEGVGEGDGRASGQRQDMTDANRRKEEQTP